jgi:hypothetical protein
MNLVPGYNIYCTNALLLQDRHLILSSCNVNKEQNNGYHIGATKMRSSCAPKIW